MESFGFLKSLKCHFLHFEESFTRNLKVLNHMISKIYIDVLGTFQLYASRSERTINISNASYICQQGYKYSFSHRKQYNIRMYTYWIKFLFAQKVI